MPIPACACLIAASIDSHCGAGCLPATITLTRWRLRRHWSVTHSRVLASGGSQTRITSAFLFTTWSMKPGSWCEKPLWSWRQTCELSRMLSEASGRRQGMLRVTLSHLACWLNIESTMWMNAS